MTKTTRDVAKAALRRIEVAAIDVAPDAATYAAAEEHFTTLYAELPGEGFTTLTDANAVPDKAFNALVQMLADDIGPTFGRPKVQNSWREGLKRLRRQYMPDNRVDAADIDKDGTVTAAEAQDDLEAQFY